MPKMAKIQLKKAVSAADLSPKKPALVAKTNLSAVEIAPKPAKKPSFVGQDSMVNVLTGLGTVKDSRMSNRWDRSLLDPDTLDTIYSEHWLARNCVDIPANDVVAKWREIKTPGLSADQIKAFAKFEKKLRLRKKVQNAIRLARKYGGAAIFLAVGGQKLEEPLDVGAIRQGAALNLIVLDRTELGLMSGILEKDEFSGGYGEPVNLRILKSYKDVHRSRFLIFRGPIAFDSRSVSYDWRFWGGSILDSSLVAAIERAEASMDSLSKALEIATVDLLKIPGLFQKLADPEATRMLRARISEGAMTRSAYKIALADKEEDFVRAEATGSLSSGAQVVQQLLQVPSGATSIPVTKLLGISPGGLNATGESDSENYYGLLNSIRENDIDPELETLDAVMCQVLFGTTFADWEYDWESFWSADKVEESTVETNRINGIVNLVNAGVLPEQIALRQLHADGIYSALTDEDVAEFEEMANEEPDDLGDVPADTDTDMDRNPAPEVPAGNGVPKPGEETEENAN